ncbi:MAG: hypothetical protein ACOY3D_03885, partial [Candidatus Omnitrophota bacterium]
MRKFVEGRKNSLAQSLIEYTMIIALVAGAIIAMHRYVFRGVFAGIKGWELQINDSINEEFPLEPTDIGGGEVGWTWRRSTGTGEGACARIPGYRICRSPLPVEGEPCTNHGY